MRPELTLRSLASLAARTSLALLALVSCSDATGSLQGGRALGLPAVSGNPGVGSSGASSSGAASSGASASGAGMTGSDGGGGPAPTWTNIYTTYFQPINTGGCGSSPTICHQLATDTGVTTAPVSGFVCGASQQQCYQGLLSATPPLVGPAFTANPTMAPLYLALYKSGVAGKTSNNMPFTLAYMFKQADLDLISAWIKAGAPNN